MEIETKDKILSAARLEFARHGLAGARVDLIARRAHVNKAMIYYHFHSKESLYQSIIDEHRAMIADFFEKNIDPKSSVEDILLNISELMHAYFADREDFMPFMLREFADGGQRLKNSMTRLISSKNVTEKLSKMINREIREGHIRKLDSKQAIISFWGMNVSYLIFAPILNSVWEIKDEKRFRKERPKEVVDLFLHGLKAK